MVSDVPLDDEAPVLMTSGISRSVVLSTSEVVIR
jgi:hypothetical protein